MSFRHTTLHLSHNLRPFTRLSQLRSQFQIRPQFPNSIGIQTRKMATDIPRFMKGVLIEKTGGVEVLQYKTDLPVPVPKQGEVLVKNDLVGINYIDTYFRTGLYPAPKPEILGRDAEGTIVKLGPGPSSSYFNLKPGDRVVWLGLSAYAEYSVAPAAKTQIIPSSLQPGVAVASLLQGLTALTLIREAYAVQRGDWVLVHAAAGGVGLILCQLISNIGGRVIATASTKEKLELAKQNGAEVVINYKEEKDGLVKRILEVTGGKGVQLVLDSTGKDQFDNDLEVVARKGTVVTYGNSSGAVPPFSVARLAAKNVKLLRPTLFNYIATREEFDTYTKELFDFIAEGKLNIKIHKTYPLSDVQQAHTDIESRVTSGKLLLKP